MRTAGIWWLALGALSAAPELSAARLIRVESNQSVAAAVARAAPGDTVLLPAGSCQETIEITRGVIVRGAGAGRTVLSCPGREAVRVHPGVSGAALVDLSVRKSQTGIAIDSGNLRIADCHIEDCKELGLSLHGPSLVEIERGFLRDNRVAILARGGADLRLSRSEIRGSEVGLDIDGAVGEVTGCTLTGNKQAVVVRGKGRLVLGDRPEAANRLFKNRNGTVENLTPVALAARYNYWGDVDCAFVRGFSGAVRYLPFMNLALDDSVGACP